MNGQPGFHTECLGDSSAVLTCLGNDFSYDDIYSFQLAAKLHKGDVLLLFSGSGNSMSVVKAAEVANRMGAVTIGFLGRDGVEETVNQIASFIKNITKEYGADKLLAVGINVPGPTDYQNGEVLSLRGFPTWKHIPLAKLLSDALCVSVTVDRDVNSGVELIKQIERLKGMMNMIYIAVDGGIGCGVMINGHTYRGNRGIAGEMGHITMMNNHQHCACGNVGSLKLSASDFAILRRCREILHLDESVPLSVDDVVQLYRDGNEEMIATFRLAVSNLAIAIRNVFMLYDPEVAYLRCRWLHTEDPLYFRLLEEVYIGNTLLEQNSIRIVLLNEDHFVLRSAASSPGQTYEVSTGTRAGWIGFPFRLLSQSKAPTDCVYRWVLHMVTMIRTDR